MAQANLSPSASQQATVRTHVLDQAMGNHDASLHDERVQHGHHRESVPNGRLAPALPLPPQAQDSLYDLLNAGILLEYREQDHNRRQSRQAIVPVSNERLARLMEQALLALNEDEKRKHKD